MVNSKDIVSIVTSVCNHCNSLKRIPDEIFEQTSSPSPSSQGEQFSVDVVRRNKQMIVVARDILSYTTSTFVPDEKANSLRSAILNTTGFLRKRNCIVRVDNAPGFLPLKDDYQLKSCGISLDYGNPKNCNKNPDIDKGIQEFESEILLYEESNKTLTPDTLQIITDQLNQRIRNRGLSSKEIIFRRDQHTGKTLTFDDDEQENICSKNHNSSATSKSKKEVVAERANVKGGDLVYIKQEGNKFNARDRYLITNIKGKNAILQKFNNNGAFMTKTYSVPLTNIFPASSQVPSNNVDQEINVHNESSSDSDESADDAILSAVENPHAESSSDDDEENTNEDVMHEQRSPLATRSQRQCRLPVHLNDYVLR